MLIQSVLLGAIGFAALTVSSTLSAQELDNRPIYYVMLKSLEDAFEAYNIALAADLEARVSRLKAGYDAERLIVTKEFEQLEPDRSHQESVFNSEREALNERIAAVNEQIALRKRRIKEERRIQKHHAPRYANDPQISALKKREATQLAVIDAVRTSYMTQSTATQKARAALTGRIEENMSAGDPLALEIRSLNEDWQRFAEKERSKLKQVADAYAVDYATYDKWLEEERAVVEEMSAVLASIHETDRKQRALHAETETLLRGVIDEYNALVEVHNKAAADDPNRDERATKFAALELRIAEFQATLSEARGAVVRTNEELNKRNQALTEHYERFTSAKRARDTTLSADLAEINATRLAVEAAIDERRQKVDAQIKSLEAHIGRELRDARRNLEVLNTRMVNSFGRDHEGFDAAMTRVLEMNDDGLLYTASGAPRFDLSRPLTATVYTAVQQLEANRREIDARIAAIEKNEGSALQNAADQPQAAGALEQELAALSAERQRLLEAYAASSGQSHAQSVELEERLRAIDARFADHRASLAEFYSARASLTRSEMQAVQQVLVAAVKNIPRRASNGSDHVKLLNALSEKAAQMNTPVEESLLAPYALMDGLASQAPPVSADLDGNAWVAFSSRKTTADRPLTGADKVALVSAWLARFRRQPRFAEMSRQLGSSAAVKDAGQALSRLFMAGVIEHTAITERRLDDGGIGIQVSVLGRDYQLDAGGSLEPLPRE